MTSVPANLTVKTLEFNGQNSVIIKFFSRTIFINYWTRSSKISRFVGGEQINYLPMPKAEANNCSASHRQIVIFCEISSNNCFIIHLQSITLSFVKINELYTQTLFLKKLPDYIIFVDFPCLQILPKNTDGRFSSFFVFSEFFSCSKQDNSSSDSSGKRAAIVYKKWRQCACSDYYL